MGVNTHGIMSSDVRVADITNVLGYKYGIRTAIEDTYENYYKIITFNFKGEERRLSVFSNVDDLENYSDFLKDVKEITLIDLNLWGSAIEIIEGILEEFGGYIIEADTNGKWRKVS